MTPKEYKSICRRIGGEDALIHMLRIIAKIGENETERDLREWLESEKPLFDLFDHSSRESEVSLGSGHAQDDGPYLELTKKLSRFKVTYGVCYGGVCGEGSEYWFMKSPNDEWIIDPEEPRLYWIH